MAKYTCDFKHKICYIYIAKPGQGLYFTFSRGVFRTLLNVRSSRLEVFCRKGVLRNFAKFTGKHLRQSLSLNKVAGLRPGTLLKKRLRRRCFPVDFPKFLRTPPVAASETSKQEGVSLEVTVRCLKRL